MPGSKGGGVCGDKKRGENSLPSSGALVLWPQVSLVNRLVHQTLRTQSSEHEGDQLIAVCQNFLSLSIESPTS